MDNYNLLAAAQAQNQSVSQRIELSKQLADKGKDRMADQFKEASNIIGGEFVKSSISQLGSKLSKMTGLESIGKLGENISKSGVTKGLAQTIAQTKDEALKKGTEFGKDKIEDLTKKTKQIAADADSDSSSVIDSIKSRVTDSDIYKAGKDNLSSKINSELKNRGLPEVSEVEKPSLTSLKQVISDRVKSPIQEGESTLASVKDSSVDLSIDSGRNISDAFRASTQVPSLISEDAIGDASSAAESAGFKALDILNKSRIARGEEPIKYPSQTTQATEDIDKDIDNQQPEVEGGENFSIAPAEQDQTTTETTVQPDKSSEPNLPPVNSGEEDEEKETESEDVGDDVDADVEEGVSALPDGVGDALEGVIGIASLILPGLMGDDSNSESTPLPPTLNISNTQGLGH
jgi:hypothetical protein